MPEDELVDTNILVRFLVKTPSEQYEAVRAYLELPEGVRPRLIVAAATISEVVFVLKGVVYKFEPSEIAAALRKILTLRIVVLDRDVVARAVSFFGTTHTDWNDCLLAAYAIERCGGALLSFDGPISRIPGLTRTEPT